MDKFLQFREQYFAEAIQIFKENPNWYYLNEELVQSQQELRFETDPWEDPLLNRIKEYKFISVHDALIFLGVSVERMDPKSKKRVLDIFKRNGWKPEGNKIAFGGDRRKSYSNPSSDETLIEIKSVKNIHGTAIQY